MPASSYAPSDRCVIAWIDNHPRAIMVLHAARHRAREQNCKWCVAYVETPARFAATEDDSAQAMLRLCTLAEQMGADVLHVQADSAEKGIAALLEAEKDHIALFVVGSADSHRYLRKWRIPVWEKVVGVASRFARVEVIPLSDSGVRRRRWRELRLRRVHPLHVFYALVAVALAHLAAQGLEWLLPPALFRVNIQNISLLFLIACAFAASRYGLVPGLTAAVAGSLTYSYVYMPPVYALKVSNITEVLNMAIFLSAGLLIALFTSRARSYAESVTKRERGTQALFTLYRIASTAFSRQQALETLQGKLSDMLRCDVAFFLPPGVHPDRVEPAVPAQVALDEPDREALEACWAEMKTTGLASPLHSDASWRFEPMIAPGGAIGVLAVRPQSGEPLDTWMGLLLTSLADQTAILVEHLELERSMQSTRIREEREKLRSMLLSSVSHDLKTPLAGIIGALSVHRSVGERLSPQRRNELLESAFEEAQRLDSFITNILDMTRLESGKIDFHPQWNDMPEIVHRVIKRTQHRLRNRVLAVHPFPPDIEVYMDALMTEQVLQNLVDNACKYTPDGTRIEIRCTAETDGYLCRVRDHGPGIPEDQIERIFDKYTRLQKEDSQAASTGLGLAICKAVMEAQKGWIRAANHPEGGMEFTFCLPEWRKAEGLAVKEIVA